MTMPTFGKVRCRFCVFFNPNVERDASAILESQNLSSIIKAVVVKSAEQGILLLHYREELLYEDTEDMPE